MVVPLKWSAGQIVVATFGLSFTEALVGRQRICTSGILRHNICCSSPCKQCGGSGCEDRPGGPSNCCRRSIKVACTTAAGPAPCIYRNKSVSVVYGARLLATWIAKAFTQGEFGVSVAHHTPEWGGHIGMILPALATLFSQSLHFSTRWVLLDVGANVGDFTSMALHLFTPLVQRRARVARFKADNVVKAEPFVEVDAVEPSPKLVQELEERRKRERWDLVANVHIHQAAAMPTCASGHELGLWRWKGWPEEFQDLSQFVAPVNRTSDGYELGATVSCGLLSELIGNKSIFFLKVDTEGKDISLLLEGRKVLDFVRFLGFEHVGFRLHSILFRVLHHQGFACFLVHPSGLFPVFGQVIEHSNFLIADRGNHIAAVGDVFCGRGCDDALPDVLRLIFSSGDYNIMMSVEMYLRKMFVCQQMQHRSQQSL